MLLVLLAIIVWFLPGHRGWFDVGVYHGAVNYWMHEGGQIYDYVRTASTYGFTYPPFAAVVMLPMAAVPWHPTIVINGVITLGAGLFLVWTIAREQVRRMGLPLVYGMGMAVFLFGALGPVRDTIMFGQINLHLMALVYLDLVLLNSRRFHRFAGVGIGLAAAIKLTPGIFLIYLLLSRRWRAALVAGATTFGATALAAIVAPDATRTYFTELMWDTSRIGSLEYVSNQSLMGLVSRHLGGGRLVWLALVVLVLLMWGYRARRADVVTGFAITGVVSVLVSPISWVHHLVWLAPGLVLLVRKESTRRLAIWCYGLLVSCLVWAWSLNVHGPLGFFGANAYVYVSLAMLGALAVPLPVPRFAQVVWELLLPLRVRVTAIALQIAGSRAAATRGLVHPSSHLEVPSPNHPASQWTPTIQVLASAHARHLR